MNRIKIPRLIFFLALFTLSACTDKQQEVQKELIRPVKVFTVGETANQQFLQLPGSVKAASSTTIAFDVPGRLATLDVEEGMEVETGDLLATLDSRDYEAAVRKAKAQRDALFTDLQRYETAAEAKAVTPQVVDDARRMFEIADADLATAEKALEDATLRAPFAGRIARRFLDNFSTVQAKQPIYELQDESTLQVTAQVAERDWVLVPPDTTPEEATAILKPVVSISALPGREFPARASSYVGTADPVTRTYTVNYTFVAPADAAVSPGMTASVRMVRPDIEQATSITIPLNAIFDSNSSQAKVWLISAEGFVSAHPIQHGSISDGALTVIGGLNIGDQIAYSGVHTLQSGMRVRPLVSDGG